MKAPAMFGEVIGSPAASLSHGAKWAVSDDAAQVGQTGEFKTARVLGDVAQRPNGPSVLHDLRIPIPGFDANIDHVVVAGDTVTLIDSKVWRPGFYWSTGSHARRGLARVDYTVKDTMRMAQERVAQFFTQRGVYAKMATPLLIVWPSHPGRTSTLFLTVPAARIIDGNKFERQATRIFKCRSADPAIVAALSSLVNK